MESQPLNTRYGMLAALAAFIFWGFVPVFFKWLESVSAYEIIAHRILWSVALLFLFLLIRDGRQVFQKMRLPPKTLALLAVSGTLVALNWLIFVWAINQDMVLSTSLGYFITPLVNVLLGFIFLGERLTRAQTIAMSIAAAGTFYLAWFLGQPPWVSLALAFSFGLYGLMRKAIQAGPMTGLLWETLILSLPAVIFLFWLGGGQGNQFINSGLQTSLLLVAAGLVTVVPLIWYTTAARQLKLSTIGFFQYLAPMISFFLAVFLFNEIFSFGHQVAFVCIWIALVIISMEPLFRARRYRLPH